MRDDLGVRLEKVAPTDLIHGQACVIDNIVGFVAKVDQLGRFVDPSTPEVSEIAEDEICVLFVGGMHELRVEAGFAPAGLKEGDLLAIDKDDGKVKKGAEKEDFPLGVVHQVDAARTPDVVLVNCNALNAFMRPVA